MLEILRVDGALGEIRRSLVTAITVAGQFYGTLVVDNMLDHAPFPAEAEALAALFAEQAGSLIEHAQLIEQLRMTNVRLLEAEKLASLGRLVAGVAHEINNPLTSVLGHADLLDGETLDDGVRASLRQIRIGAERIGAIVRNLQVFAGQQHSGQVEFDVNRLVAQTLALKHSELMLDRIEVRSYLAPILPGMWGDAGQLGQVLLNLLANAHYALRERPEPRILTISTWFASHPPASAPARLRSADHGVEWLYVAISDNGAGIPPEVLPRIFEPFFTTKPVGQGTGLGLSVCYGIVADHGGRIWATSQPQHGTTFSIELPVRALEQR